ncbi:MAG: CoA transferase, partial [Rhodospirillales bacterium]|nr:CoA transferase [Rhodospirillales bacterium]
PIYRMNEVFADPQVQHLGITRTVQHPVLGAVDVIGQPIELSRTPWSIRSDTPEPGEHTEAILREVGFADAEIATLRDKRVV